MEKDSDRQKEMEGHRSTGQGSQRAVVPMEEEEEMFSSTYTLVIIQPLKYCTQQVGMPSFHSAACPLVRCVCAFLWL
jgi:hypothetical protein